MKEVIAARTRPVSTNKALKFERAHYVGFAIGPRSLHHVCKIKVGGQVHYLAVGQVLHLEVTDKHQVEVLPLLLDGGDYEAPPDTTGNDLAGWSFGNTGTRDSAPLANYLECVPLHVIGYECRAELAAGAPRRHPYIAEGRITMDNTPRDRLWIPIAGRRRVTLAIEVELGETDADFDLQLASSYDPVGGEEHLNIVEIESTIVVVAGTDAGRVIENEHANMLIVRGEEEDGEAGGSTIFMFYVEARDEP